MNHWAVGWIERTLVKVLHNDVDGIIYTIAASLGFACSENISYVLSMGADIGYIRAFTAVPLHASASGIMGYYFGRARISNDPVKERYYIKKGFITMNFVEIFCLIN